MLSPTTADSTDSGYGSVAVVRPGVGRTRNEQTGSREQLREKTVYSWRDAGGAAAGSQTGQGMMRYGAPCYISLEAPNGAGAVEQQPTGRKAGQGRAGRRIESHRIAVRVRWFAFVGLRSGSRLLARKDADARVVCRCRDCGWL